MSTPSTSDLESLQIAMTKFVEWFQSIFPSWLENFQKEKRKEMYRRRYDRRGKRQ